ncbi:MAG: RNA polymerase sigma factor [Rhodothermales bacterium]
MKLAKQQSIFDAWISTHKGLLFKVVRAYAFTPADQEDLFQEITIQLWHSIPNFKGKAAIPTWIYRVALYAALSWTRNEKRHTSGKEPLSGVVHTLESINETSDPRLEWLYAEIGKLDPVDRSLMLLMLEGFSYKEMASTLGISENNVGVKINRIKKRLTLKSREESTYGL